MTSQQISFKFRRKWKVPKEDIFTTHIFSWIKGSSRLKPLVGFERVELYWREKQLEIVTVIYSINAFYSHWYKIMLFRFTYDQ